MSLEGWLLLLVIAFLIGYITGHRQGKTEGFREGAVFAPIEMRHATLERGRCIICGTAAKRKRDKGHARNARTDPAKRNNRTIVYPDERNP
ncbi:MAG: hypothetical protein GX969_00980 [Firmicutes bacterium]|jgi:hypothetical protein|nr:hypothetical protein [Bacillota bacterium]